jgi:gliding motility-associated-like protein
VAKFNINDSLQCFRSHLFAFTNNSSEFDNTIYNWEFGNGDTSKVKNPNHQYDSIGFFKTKLSIVTKYGCTDSIIKNLEVHPMPVSDFTMNDTGQCFTNNLFTFTNQSTIPYNKFEINWDLDDGTSSIKDTVVHTFKNWGKYKIRLVALSEKNCSDTLFKELDVYPMPSIKFELSDTAMCQLGNVFTFNNLSTLPYDTIKYDWHFGDNGTSNSQSPIYSYQNEGIYNIQLKGTSEWGCIDSTKSKVEIYPMPIAKFTINDSTSCLKGNLFSFKNESQISDTSNLTYSWDLGDGTQINTSNLSHQYQTFGFYIANLISTSNKGCKDTLYKNISIYEHPTIKYTINNLQACLRDNKFILKDVTKHTSSIKNWDWVFYKANSGKDSIFNTSSMEIKFNSIGKFHYQLIVTDSNSCQDTIKESLNVFPQSSLKIITDTVCFGDKNTFKSNNTIDTGFINELKWHFGDGQNDNKPNTTHTYKTSGTYNIKLTSTNSFGCKDTLTKNNAAQSREIPTASFTYEKTLDSLTYTGYQFKSNSIGMSNLDHVWTYNTDETSTLKNPYILFADSGMKWVKLEVKDEFGCNDETGKWIKVMPDIVVYVPNAFTPNEDGINDQFKPFGIVYAKEYEWIILDRWGEIIFKSNNQLDGWDGKIKNKLVPDGVYTYQLKVTTAQNKKLKFAGTFHLIY